MANERYKGNPSGCFAATTQHIASELPKGEARGTKVPLWGVALQLLGPTPRSGWGIVLAYSPTGGNAKGRRESFVDVLPFCHLLCQSLSF